MTTPYNLEQMTIKALEFQNAGDNDTAERLFLEILTLDPKHLASIYSLSVISSHKGDPQRAMDLVDSLIAMGVHYGPAYFVKAMALQNLRRLDEALLNYDTAVQVQPDLVGAWINRGVLLEELKRHKEALDSFDKVLSFEPTNQGALANRGIILSEMGRDDWAARDFEALLQLNPDFEYGVGLLAFARMHTCDWRDFEALRARIIDGVRDGKRICKSLPLLSFSDLAADQTRSAEIFAAHRNPPRTPILWKGERYNHQRIKVAYLSPDLREHPVGHLMAGIFERHDRQRFEIIGLSLGIDDGSRLRGRIRDAMEHFYDVRLMGALQIAEFIRAMEVDIVVDLAGYTADSRTEVLAHRPAPVQVNYLGYPGSMGVDYFDYILADRQVIPDDHRSCYRERVAYLPHAYLPMAADVAPAERTPTRSEMGLPETGFVFCSFNHDYKINPPIFDVWMRLLQQVEGSVLWLMKLNEAAQENLRKEAAARGVDPTRIIFATRVPRVEDHLARYRLAGIFLDTYPYNAHTTANDALMVGLPVVTYMGHCFPGRVAGSLLTAARMPELITHSLADYEALALSLATQPDKLEAVKAKLATQRMEAPLFSAETMVSGIEAAFTTMWQRYQQGLMPVGFGVHGENTSSP